MAQVVPGSQRLEVPPPHCINNDARIHGLELDPPSGADKANGAD